MMVEGTKYLLGNLPEAQMPNIYYWYYASQVLHNMSGYEWDQWNRDAEDPGRHPVPRLQHLRQRELEPVRRLVGARAAAA